MEGLRVSHSAPFHDCTRSHIDRHRLHRNALCVGIPDSSIDERTCAFRRQTTTPPFAAKAVANVEAPIATGNVTEPADKTPGRSLRCDPPAAEPVADDLLDFLSR
jgi:hypothetical protein